MKKGERASEWGGEGEGAREKRASTELFTVTANLLWKISFRLREEIKAKRK